MGRRGSAAGARGVFAKGLVAQPQPFIAAPVRLAHHLRLMRIREPLGHGALFAPAQALVGNLLDAAAQPRRGGGAVRQAAGAVNSACAGRRRCQPGQQSGASGRGQEGFHLLMPRSYGAGLGSPQFGRSMAQVQICFNLGKCGLPPPNPEWRETAAGCGAGFPLAGSGLIWPAHGTHGLAHRFPVRRLIGFAGLFALTHLLRRLGLCPVAMGGIERTGIFAGFDGIHLGFLLCLSAPHGARVGHGMEAV